MRLRQAASFQVPCIWPGVALDRVGPKPVNGIIDYPLVYLKPVALTQLLGGKGRAEVAILFVILCDDRLANFRGNPTDGDSSIEFSRGHYH